MSDMNIGDTVTIINTNDVWEGKTGVLEYIDDFMATVLVDFNNDKKVRQDFDIENIANNNKAIDSIKENDSIPMEEEKQMQQSQTLLKKLFEAVKTIDPECVVTKVGIFPGTYFDAIKFKKDGAIVTIEVYEDEGSITRINFPNFNFHDCLDELNDFMWKCAPYQYLHPCQIFGNSNNVDDVVLYPNLTLKSYWSEDWTVKEITDYLNIVDKINDFMKDKKQNIKEDTNMDNEDLNMDEEKARLALVKYLGVDDDSVYRDNNSYSVDLIFDVEDDNAQYLVCTAEEARAKAEDEVRQSFDELGLEAFTETFRDWIIRNAVDEDAIKDIVREYQESYVNDIENERDDEFDNRLYAELFDEDLLKEEDFEDEDHFRAQLKDEVYDKLEDLKSEYVDILMEREKPLDILTNMYGDGGELGDFLMDNNAIDIDKVAEEAVDEDGVAHFIAYYDGEEIDLGDDMFAYRQN